MKILIVGCGRVGSMLANRYASAGHEVNVIDEEGQAAARLAPDFTGNFFAGAGLDVSILKTAGIKDSDVCIAVTDGDNTNLVVAQIAKEHYKVPCVVVRVFDPRRADFYAGRGLNVVSPVAVAVDQIDRAICAFGEGEGEAS